MFFLEFFAGATIGIVLRRLGMPSIYSILFWIPLLSMSGNPFFLIGLSAAAVIDFAEEESLSLIPSIFFGTLAVIVGLFFYELFFPYLAMIEFLIPIILVGIILWILFSAETHFFPLCGGIILCLVLGWLSLREWEIPFALPALLWGLFAMHPDYFFSSVKSGSVFSWVGDSFIGIMGGILPGMSPGIMGLVHGNGNHSPILLYTNLVFSLGVVSISGKVRSVPAAVLSSFVLPHWLFLVILVMAGALFSVALFTFFIPLPFPYFSKGWAGIQFFFLFVMGGIGTTLLALLAFSVFNVLKKGNLSPSLGLMVLFLPLIWFYGPF